MQRKGITDKNVLERVAKYLYDNIGNRTSMKSISDNIEGQIKIHHIIQFQIMQMHLWVAI